MRGAFASRPALRLAIAMQFVSIAVAWPSGVERGAELALTEQPSLLSTELNTSIRMPATVGGNVSLLLAPTFTGLRTGRGHGAPSPCPAPLPGRQGGTLAPF